MVSMSKCWMVISIHALREEGDFMTLPNSMEIVEFLSTPSARRATSPPATWPASSGDFYPRPPRGGRHQECRQAKRLWVISIHALREEGDIGKYVWTDGTQISIHALREEGDLRQSFRFTMQTVFLSTPSARRATCSCDKRASVYHISIHALREEGDSRVVALSALPSNFYPRPPRGGRQIP